MNRVLEENGGVDRFVADKELASGSYDIVEELEQSRRRRYRLLYVDDEGMNECVVRVCRVVACDVCGGGGQVAVHAVNLLQSATGVRFHL